MTGAAEVVLGRCGQASFLDWTTLRSGEAQMNQQRPAQVARRLGGEQWDVRNQPLLQANGSLLELLCAAPGPHLTSESCSQRWAVGSPLLWGIRAWRTRLRWL